MYLDFSDKSSTTRFRDAQNDTLDGGYFDIAPSFIYPLVTDFSVCNTALLHTKCIFTQITFHYLGANHYFCDNYLNKNNKYL